MVMEQLILALIILSGGIAFNNGHPRKRSSMQHRLVPTS